MATAVILPKQGQSVESCVIGEWLKKVGDEIKIGDVLFTYETDKSAFAEEAKTDGTLLAVFFEQGEDVPCLTAVAVIGQRGEDVSSFVPKGGVSPAQKAAIPAQAEFSAASFAPTAERALGISARARAAAERMNLDINSAAPSGPNGRIIERDVLALAGNRIGGIGQTAAPQTGAQTPLMAIGAFKDEKMSPARRIIAKNMFESLQGTAQLTHTASFDATEILALRARYKAEKVAITLNDMILFAASRVLRSCAYMNAHCLGETLRTFEHVHLGVAVDTPRGLLVPTLFNADEKSLAEIAAEARSLALAARDGNISPDLLQGGTFTVSNLGAYGIEHFTPVINPPQVSILGVNCITERVRTLNGVVTTYPAMGLSLTYDHRAVDGGPASKFLQELANALAHFGETAAQCGI